MHAPNLYLHFTKFLKEIFRYILLIAPYTYESVYNSYSVHNALSLHLNWIPCLKLTLKLDENKLVVKFCFLNCSKLSRSMDIFTIRQNSTKICAFMPLTLLSACPSDHFKWTLKYPGNLYSIKQLQMYPRTKITQLNKIRSTKIYLISSLVSGLPLVHFTSWSATIRAKIHWTTSLIIKAPFICLQYWNYVFCWLWNTTVTPNHFLEIELPPSFNPCLNVYFMSGVCVSMVCRGGRT